MECNILLSKNGLYFIFCDEIKPNTCICTLSPPKEIKPVINIIFNKSDIFKVLANFTPCVISNIPDIITSRIGGSGINLFIIVVKIKKIVTIPSSKNIEFRLSKILSVSSSPNDLLVCLNSVLLLVDILLFLFRIIPTSRPLIMCDISIIRPNVLLFNRVVPIIPKINNGLE